MPITGTDAVRIILLIACTIAFVLWKLIDQIPETQPPWIKRTLRIGVLLALVVCLLGLVGVGPGLL